MCVSFVFALWFHVPWILKHCYSLKHTCCRIQGNSKIACITSSKIMENCNDVTRVLKECAGFYFYISWESRFVPVLSNISRVKFIIAYDASFYWEPEFRLMFLLLFFFFILGYFVSVCFWQSSKFGVPRGDRSLYLPRAPAWFLSSWVAFCHSCLVVSSMYKNCEMRST